MLWLIRFQTWRLKHPVLSIPSTAAQQDQPHSKLPVLLATGAASGEGDIRLQVVQFSGLLNSHSIPGSEEKTEGARLQGPQPQGIPWWLGFGWRQGCQSLPRCRRRPLSLDPVGTTGNRARGQQQVQRKAAPRFLEQSFLPLVNVLWKPRGGQTPPLTLSPCCEQSHH